MPASPVRFDPTIKSLFRAFDISAMKKAFDLSSYTDVKANAPKILAKLKSGAMPCDGPWPAEHIALFETWISDGLLP